jgi:4-hydroxy 2-oxovalerate aldolase
MVNKKKSNINLLDCTLRDGGYVNDFNFGKDNINKIINRLSTTNVELIEIGFLKNNQHSEDQSIFNSVSEAELLLTNTPPHQQYCLMIRPDWYNINNLEKCAGKIKSLRFAFHYEDLELTLHQAEVARSYGYKIFFNPVNVLSYSHDQLRQILHTLNQFKPEGIYIVDTFGSMLPSDLRDLYPIFNAELDADVALGLHLHENLSIALAIAINFIDLVDNTRQVYIDSSVLGIGRVPGNLCTELIMNYLNTIQGETYNLTGVYELIDAPIADIKKTNPWGYIPAYAVAGFNKTHRSYAEHLLQKPNLSTSDVVVILNKIQSKEDREEFNEELIEGLCVEFLTNTK